MEARGADLVSPGSTVEAVRDRERRWKRATVDVENDLWNPRRAPDGREVSEEQAEPTQRTRNQEVLFVDIEPMTGSRILGDRHDGTLHSHDRATASFSRTRTAPRLWFPQYGAGPDIVDRKRFGGERNGYGDARRDCSYRIIPQRRS